MSNVSFTPNSLSFGNVATGNKASQTVTVTNQGAQAVTLSVSGSAFTLSPSPASVPAASGGTAGSLVVTVTFLPTAQASYTQTISGSDGSCSLAGTGVDPASMTGSGSDPNQFETEFAAGQSQDTGKKYYQIVVPGFAEASSTGPSFPNVVKADMTSAGSVPSLSNANSFLRLGTPPDPTSDWSQSPFQNSVNLARLVGDPWVIAAAENMTLNAANTSVTSTVTDSSTASSMVPGSTGSTSSATSASGWNDNFEDGGGNPSITSDDANTFGALYAVGDGTTFGNAFNSNQDASYFPGFADDTRQRGSIAQSQADGANNTCPATTNVSNTAVANMPWNRQAETMKLLSKGGWWDHSDGNRVTTTSGDKIEVIQGNYKLVVLGRQPVPTPPAASAPTSEAVDDYRKQLTALAGNAFITDVSGGHFQEQYPSPTPCIKTVEYVQDDSGEWTLYQDNGLGNLITKLKGRTVDLFEGTSRETYVGLSDKSSNDMDPDLTAKTWAKSVFNQVGSEDKPVGWGGDKHSSTGEYIRDTEPNPVGSAPKSASKGDVVNLTWAMRIRNYTGSLAAHVKHIYSETHADEIQTYTFGESSVTINGVLNNFSLTMGVVESINIGAMLDVQLGPKSSVCIDWMQFNGTKNVVEGQRAEATAAANRLRGIENSIRNAQNGISGLANDIINLSNRVTDTTTQIDQRVTNLGMAHWNLYGQVNMGL